MTADVLGAVAGIACALLWGGADFAGGLAARCRSAVEVLVPVGVIGVIVLVPAGLAAGEAPPSASSALWAVLGGCAGAVGIAALYRALAEGDAAIVSPTAAVIGAALPVVLGVLSQGLPPASRLGGVLCGLTGIWLVSRSAPSCQEHLKRDLSRAALAGISFGCFFISLAQVAPGSLFYPLAIGKAASIAVAVVYLRGRWQGWAMGKASLPAFAAGVLDAGGNVTYMLARQLIRLDVAAVLVSMYPAITVLLARLIWGQRLGVRQWIGVGVCVASVGLLVV